MKRAHSFDWITLFLSVLVVFSSPHAEAQTAEQGSYFWFKFSDPKANEAANAAVGNLSKALADLITGLSAGRGKGAIYVDSANAAVSELKEANGGFEKVLPYIGEKKIDLNTIQKSGSSAIYYDLVDSLKRAGYPNPVDGKSLISLIQTIINNMIKDLEVLHNYSPNQKSITFSDAQRAFFDVILQKILLEKLGATTGIITTAMQ